MDVADYYARASYDILCNIAKGIKRQGEERNAYRRLLTITRINRTSRQTLEAMAKKAGAELKAEISKEVREEIQRIGQDKWLARYEERAIADPIRAIESQALDRLNAVNTRMRLSAEKMASDAFAWLNAERYRALSTGTAEVATGTLTLQQAMEAVIKRLAQSDLTAFEDKAGRRWTPEAYVAMDIQTTLHNARNRTAQTIGEQAGATVFYVTTHADSRPLCEPYQGHYYSTDGTSGTIYDVDGNPHEYEPLENTTYGEPGGLFGVNCKHDRIPVIDGLFRDRSREEQPADAEGYKDTQKARGMERGIRALKREAGILKAGGMDISRLRDRIDERTESYYRFCGQAGIRERDDRLSIY